jgi:fructokinase
MMKHSDATVILCIGEALVDMICTDRGRSLSEGEHFLRKPGGAPTNVAAAIAALGGDVRLAAKVGADPFGQMLHDVMRSFGVDIRHLRQDPDHFTTLAFVSLMEDGERDFHFNRGADGHLGPDDVGDISLDGLAILHFGSATAFLPGPLQEAYRALHDRGRAAGRFLSFDPNYRHLLYRDRIPSFRDQSGYFIRHCDFFKVSDEEALLITAAGDLAGAARALRAMGPAVFAITLGREGTLLCVGDETAVVPSIPVEVTDTTGAGDAFVGAVLYLLASRHALDMRGVGMAGWQRIIALANRAGARTCEHLGAMEAFRHLDVRIFD